MWVNREHQGCRCLLNFQVLQKPSRTDGQGSDHFLQADLNEAARAADASREAKGAVYGERLK